MREVIDVKAEAEPRPAPGPAPNAAAPAIGGSPALPADELTRITGEVVRALKTVYDPEIPVDIYELGLIYKVDLSDDRLLTIDMTLTAPGCPVAGEMPGWVESAVKAVEGVSAVKVNMVFEPPWSPAKMSDEARLELGWM
ncbi:MAG: SUF system Fe-S cluster assembly protein [Parvularculaceae bacterium]